MRRGTPLSVSRRAVAPLGADRSDEAKFPERRAPKFRSAHSGNDYRAPCQAATGSTREPSLSDSAGHHGVYGFSAKLERVSARSGVT